LGFPSSAQIPVSHAEIGGIVEPIGIDESPPDPELKRPLWIGYDVRAPRILIAADGGMGDSDESFRQKERRVIYACPADVGKHKSHFRGDRFRPAKLCAPALVLGVYERVFRPISFLFDCPHIDGICDADKCLPGDVAVKLKPKHIVKITFPVVQHDRRPVERDAGGIFSLPPLVRVK